MLPEEVGDNSVATSTITRKYNYIQQVAGWKSNCPFSKKLNNRGSNAFVVHLMFWQDFAGWVLRVVQISRQILIGLQKLRKIYTGFIVPLMEELVRPYNMNHKFITPLILF